MKQISDRNYNRYYDIFNPKMAIFPIESNSKVISIVNFRIAELTQHLAMIKEAKFKIYAAMDVKDLRLLQDVVTKTLNLNLYIVGRNSSEVMQ